MNRRIGLTGVVAASCLIFTACGGGSGDDSPDAGGNPAVDAGGDVADAGDTPDGAVPDPDAAPMLTGLDAVCAPDGPFANIFAKAIECINPQIGFVNLFGTDLFGGAAMSQTCFDILTPQIDSGTVSVDDSKLAACNDFIAAATCLELDLDNIDGTPCGDVFVGTVATDGECDVNAQCIGDAFCQPNKGCGSCQSRFALEASCSADEQCSAGKCNASGVCAAPVATGGACAGSADCAGSLTCSLATDTCEDPFPQVGDTCVNDSDCGGLQASTFCQPGATAEDPSTCQKLPQAGEACVTVQNFGQPVCDPVNYVWCLPSTNVCQAPTISAVGEPCNAVGIIGAGARQCASGLACTDPFAGFEGGAGTCVAPGFQGDSCTVDTGDNVITAVCHPNYACDAGTCDGNFDFSGVCPAP